MAEKMNAPRDAEPWIDLPDISSCKGSEVRKTITVLPRDEIPNLAEPADTSSRGTCEL